MTTADASSGTARSKKARTVGLDVEQTPTEESHVPSVIEKDLREIAPGVWFLPGFGNTTIVLGSDGVAVVDPGLFRNGPRVVKAIRQITEAPIRYVIYTHGHFDHAFGTPALLDDAARRGDPPPEVVGHVNVARRFERYAKTSGHVAVTFDLQFASWGKGGGDVVRRARFVPPTIEFETTLSLDLGGLTLQCRHGLGETDDHTWVWMPEVRVIVGGDFIVSSLPNAGTPFRVQRYVLEWAETLEAMAAVDPLAIVSGHGDVFTSDAQEMLAITAAACRWLDAEVVRRLNEGQWDEEILSEVELPAEFARSRYLQPLYGCTAFAVRDLLRRYKGWYDGNPTMLFPARRSEVATEILGLVDPERVLARVVELTHHDDVSSAQLALHLLDFLIFADGVNALEAKQRKAQLLEQRAEFEASFVAQNVLRSAAATMRQSLP